MSINVHFCPNDILMLKLRLTKELPSSTLLLCIKEEKDIAGIFNDGNMLKISLNNASSITGNIL